MVYRTLLLSLNLAATTAFVVGHAPLRSPTATRSSRPVAIFDNDRLRAAGLAALTSLVLVASPMPAYAKGGGHGGGGGGSSHSSYHSSRSSAPSRPSYPRSATLSSRSSSRSSSSRRGSSGSSSTYSTTASSERNIRIFPTTAEAREQGGLICPANLPTVGTKVDINGVGTATVLESQPALQSGLYGKAAGARSMAGLPPGFDAGCTLQVQYADGIVDTVSAAKAPPSAIDEAFDNPLFALAAYGGFYTAIGAMNSLASFSNYDEQRDNYRAFLEDDDDRPDAPPSLASEMSGEYWGGSDESDDGDQALRQTLRFKSDGRITGHGRDSEDGSYRIKSGRWVMGGNGRVEVAWEEKYDEGFTAICMGKYDTKTGQISGRFVSSREVTGWFTLAKKPSIF